MCKSCGCSEGNFLTELSYDFTGTPNPLRKGKLTTECPKTVLQDRAFGEDEYEVTDLEEEFIAAGLIDFVGGKWTRVDPVELDWNFPPFARGG